MAPVYFVAGFLILFSLSACAPGDGMELVSEAEERSFQRGKQLLREGRRQEALSAFLSVIEKRRGEAPESHLEAGELFRTHIRDPISSIYHYRKYLELTPNSAQAPHVRQLIDTATKDFAAALPAQPMRVQHERLDLLEAMERLQRENVELKQEISSLRQERARLQLTTAGAVPRAPSSAPAVTPQQRSREAAPAASPSHRTYTVEGGDTLSRISGKMYGTNSRWSDIFEANRDVLRDENSLKIGMKLRIPE